MRAVVQRVSRAKVLVREEDGTQYQSGAVGPGLCVFLGVARGDDEADARWMAEKIAGLRIFEDEEGRMNRDLLQAGGSVLAVSQFTLLGDVRKGKRPSFIEAMDPLPARQLYLRTCERLRELGLEVQEGKFQAHMQVELVNEGPVTILLDSKKLF